MRIPGTGIRSAGLPVLPVFFAGFAGGILIMHIGKSVLLENTGLFDEYTLYRMSSMTVDCNALFSYILRERLVRMLILTVLSTTYLGFAVCAGTVVWYGMSAGAFAAALFLRYGFKGFFLALAAVFPQALIYVPALWALLVWCETVYRGIYEQKIGFWEEKSVLWKKLARLALIYAAAAAGCLLEAYVNPAIFLGYLKFF